MTKRFLVLLCASLLSVDPSAVRAESPSPAAPSVSAVKGFGDLPLSFAANRGQSDPRVNFLSSGSGYSIFLTADGALMTLGYPAKTKSSLSPGTDKSAQGTSIRMQLLGSKPAAKVSGAEELPGKVNYLIGNDRANWHTDIPTFARVRYAGVYPGVDMVYYGNQKRLEFDFVLQPGADPGKLDLRFSGSAFGKGKRLKINAQGDLIVSGNEEHVILRKPVLYQTGLEKDSTVRHSVEGGFVLAGGGNIRFRIGDYDRSKPLVIDPTIAYSTLVGGDGENPVLAVDPTGSVYLSSQTYAPNFPVVTPGAIKTTCTYSCIFVTKLNPSGTEVIYSTFFGSPKSSGNDFTSGIAADAAGNVYLTGSTDAADFPTTPGAYQTKFIAGPETFISKLNATGSGLIFSTLFGNRAMYPGPIALDKAGNIYIAGLTQDLSGFPSTPGVFQPGPIEPMYNGGFELGYVAKFNPDASTLIYASELGAQNTLIHGAAVDPAGNFYVTGYTDDFEGLFPITPGAYSDQGTAFVAKINPAATKLVYSTRIPGILSANGIAIDSSTNAYIAGTAAFDFPVTPGALQSNCGNGDSCYNSFALKLNTSGTGLVYATYLGGTPPVDPDTGEPLYGTLATGIAVDSRGDAYVTGSTNYPKYKTTPGSFQPAYSGTSDQYPGLHLEDAFLTELNPAGSGLLYSTFLGGIEQELGEGVILDASGGAYIFGYTLSFADFPTTPGASVRTPIKPDGENAFVSKFDFSAPFCSLAASALIIAPKNGLEDGYALEAKFTLGGADTIDPLTEPVKIGVGPYSVIIPQGSFKLTPQGYSYQGSINGVTTTVVLRPARQGDDPALAAAPSRCTSPVYFLAAGGYGAQLESATNPLPITIRIGSDSGTAKVTAVMEH